MRLTNIALALMLSLVLCSAEDGGVATPCNTSTPATITIDKGVKLELGRFETSEAALEEWTRLTTDPAYASEVIGPILGAYLTPLYFTSVTCEACAIPGACERKVYAESSSVVIEAAVFGHGSKDFRIEAETTSTAAIHAWCTPCNNE